MKSPIVAVRLVEPSKHPVPCSTLRQARSLAVSTVITTLIASSSACMQAQVFENELVQEGFRPTSVASTQKSGDGPLIFVKEFENIGRPAAAATFVLVLRKDDGGTVWTGRATIEDIEAGEKFEVTYEDDKPFPPEGGLNIQWRVENVIR